MTERWTEESNSGILVACGSCALFQRLDDASLARYVPSTVLRLSGHVNTLEGDPWTGVIWRVLIHGFSRENEGADEEKTKLVTQSKA
jgi:hypothetical protein